MTSIAPSPGTLPRSIRFALALTASLWAFGARIASARAAEGITRTIHRGNFDPLLHAAFLVFLIGVGFTAIHWIATRQATFREVNLLPARSTLGLEWRIGAAVGWALALAGVLPVVLVGDLTPTFWWQWPSLLTALTSLAAIALFTFASELLFRGYIFAQLTGSIGSVAATVLVSAAYALVTEVLPTGGVGLGAVAAFALSVLLCMSYQRTRSIALAFGLHFAWTATIAIFFGLPVRDASLYSGVVDSTAHGARWLAGGINGPETSLLAVIFTCAAMAVVYKLTRDFAWHYTAPVIVGAGYAMDVAPPKAHTDMEAAATARVPLVQILSSTPEEASTSASVREHLRSDREP